MIRDKQSPLVQGNHAQRNGQYAAAIRHYALGLVDETSHRSGPIAAQLAANLVRARGLYRRQARLEAAPTGRGLQVAVACWSLSENPAGRAHTLASLYQDLAEQPDGGIAQVCLIGSRFARRGRELWGPIRQEHRLPIHSVLVEDEADFMAQAIELVSAHPVDLVHLSKLRLPNLLFGLLYRLLWDARVLVDCDDDELAFVGAEQPQPLAAWLQTHQGLPPLRDLPGRGWTELAMSFVQAFDGVSVANRALQERHGGTILRHARDPRAFQSAGVGAAERRRRARARWQLRPAQQVIAFLGTPRAHKGLLETAQALASLNRAEPGRLDLLYLIVGGFPASEQGLQQTLDALHASGALAVRRLEDQPLAAVPELLAAADLIVLLQDPDSAAARVQTPAKLSDALALGLTVLAEPTPGLADLQEQGAFIPVTRATLVAALRTALEAGRAQRTPPLAAHPVFERELSVQVNRARRQTHC